MMEAEPSPLRLTRLQREIIIGSLLGDGSMRCKRHALFEVNHSIHQRPYVDWKYDHLSNLVFTAPKVRNGNGSRIAYRFTTRSLECLTPLYETFYPEGRKRLCSVELTPLALAVWFMDDGSRSRASVYFNSQQFDAESQRVLLVALSDQHGIRASLNRDKSYSRIRIAVESIERLKGIISPHVLPMFAYKLPR